MTELFVPIRDRVQNRWIEVMQNEQAYWFHDGNPQRPYAALTGGNVSNFYADCTPIVSRPDLIAHAASDLLVAATGFERPDAYSGSAYGAIALALELVRFSGVKQAWYTTKGATRGEMVLDRFNFSAEIRTVALVEDVVTEFTTSRGSIRAIEKKRAETGAVGKILPYVLCIVNRSGREEIDGYRIIALIAEQRAKTWSPGQNPFTADGNEHVDPMRPKQNWAALMREYR